VLDDLKKIKFLIDEDLSPAVARYLCNELFIDAIAVRDRGLLGAKDYQVLEYAFHEERILVTANVRDFEKVARITEIHAGLVFICQGYWEANKILWGAMRFCGMSPKMGDAEAAAARTPPPGSQY